MSRIARATGRALLVTVMVCGAATLAWSHHAAAPVFDMNAEKTVRGVVKQVDWTNPHIWIWLDVQNASAQVETWGFEGMSPNFLARRGWTRTSLLPGMRITVTFRPLRDGKAGGMFMTGKLEDGKVLTSAGAE